LTSKSETTFFQASGQARRAKFASDMVLHDGWGYISGLGPVDLENDSSPLPEGVENQVLRIFANLKRILADNGVSPGQVISVRVHLVEFPRLFERMNAVYLGFFQDQRLPARSCIGVSDLTRGAQVEMDFVVSTRSEF
jgi:enamine deaminase RidA (YjgF/YER057c/UK114 family)